MVSRQCILAMELEDIGREKFDGLLAKRQICQYFPPSINCAIRYFAFMYTLCMSMLHGQQSICKMVGLPN